MMFFFILFSPHRVRLVDLGWVDEITNDQLYVDWEGQGERAQTGPE